MVRKLAYLAAAAMVVTSGAAVAQTSATQSTSGSVKIMAPITIQENAGLSFGSVYRPATVGASSVITMPTTSDTPTVGAGGAALASGGAARSRAAYTVSGEASQGYSITVPATFPMNRTGGGSLTVNLTPSKAAGTLSSSGSDTFHVGGNFTLGQDALAGDYSGTFNVTVAYN